MQSELVLRLLAWCTLINLVLLTLWWLFVVFAGGWVFRLHTKWFKLSRETFDAVHYAGMAFFKIVIFVFNLVPYLVLRAIA